MQYTGDSSNITRAGKELHLSYSCVHRRDSGGAPYEYLYIAARLEQKLIASFQHSVEYEHGGQSCRDPLWLTGTWSSRNQVAALSE